MTEQQLEKIITLVERENANMTKRKAKLQLQKIGVLDKKGEVTEPYKGVFVKNKA